MAELEDERVLLSDNAHQLIEQLTAAIRVLETAHYYAHDAALDKAFHEELMSVGALIESIKEGMVGHPWHDMQSRVLRVTISDDIKCLIDIAFMHGASAGDHSLNDIECAFNYIASRELIKAKGAA